MKSYIHAKNSVNKYGGEENDYIEIHTFLDSTKGYHPDVRHRAILHNSWGVFLCEKLFGYTIENSDGKKVSVRDIAEDHIIEDVGKMPTLSDYLSMMPFPSWIWGERPLKNEVEKINNDNVHQKIKNLEDEVKDIKDKHHSFPFYNPPIHIPASPSFDKNSITD